MAYSRGCGQIAACRDVALDRRQRLLGNSLPIFLILFALVPSVSEVVYKYKHGLLGFLGYLHCDLLTFRATC